MEREETIRITKERTSGVKAAPTQQGTLREISNDPVYNVHYPPEGSMDEENDSAQVTGKGHIYKNRHPEASHMEDEDTSSSSNVKEKTSEEEHNRYINKELQ